MLFRVGFDLCAVVRVIDTDLIDVAPGADALLMFDGDRGTEPVPLTSIDAHARLQFCSRWLGRTALYLGDDLVTFGLSLATTTGPASTSMRCGSPNPAGTSRSDSRGSFSTFEPTATYKSHTGHRRGR